MKINAKQKVLVISGSGGHTGSIVALIIVVLLGGLIAVVYSNQSYFNNFGTSTTSGTTSNTSTGATTVTSGTITSYQVTIKVIDAVNSNPIAGAQIFLSTGAGNAGSGVTNSQGIVVFTLAAATYLAQVSQINYFANSQSFAVPSVTLETIALTSVQQVTTTVITTTSTISCGAACQTTTVITTTATTGNVPACNPGATTCTLTVTSVSETPYGNFPNAGDTINVQGTICSGGCSFGAASQQVNLNAITNAQGIATFSLPNCQASGFIPCNPATSSGIDWTGQLTVTDTFYGSHGTLTWSTANTITIYYVVHLAIISGVDNGTLGISLIGASIIMAVVLYVFFDKGVRKRLKLRLK